MIGGRVSKSPIPPAYKSEVLKKFFHLEKWFHSSLKGRILDAKLSLKNNPLFSGRVAKILVFDTFFHFLIQKES